MYGCIKSFLSSSGKSYHVGMEIDSDDHYYLTEKDKKNFKKKPSNDFIDTAIDMAIEIGIAGFINSDDSVSGSSNDFGNSSSDSSTDFGGGDFGGGGAGGDW